MIDAEKAKISDILLTLDGIVEILASLSNDSSALFVLGNTLSNCVEELDAIVGKEQTS